MKIVLTTASSSIDGDMDQHFGRAPGFLIYDSERRSVEYIDNQINVDALQGAGIQAAQHIIEKGAECVITGHVGPKAFKVLNSAGVKVFNSNADTIKESLALFNSGKLKEAES